MRVYICVCAYVSMHAYIVAVFMYAYKRVHVSVSACMHTCKCVHTTVSLQELTGRSYEVPASLLPGSEPDGR